MKQKRSNEPGKMPLVGDLADGQLAVNTRDAILFMRKTVGETQSVVRVGAEMSAPVAATLKEATLPAFRAAIGTLGDGQVWTDVAGSRAISTTYTNATGRAIFVSVAVTAAAAQIETRADSGSSWMEVARIPSGASVCVLMPAGGQYRLVSSGSPTIAAWAELR